MYEKDALFGFAPCTCIQGGKGGGVRDNKSGHYNRSWLKLHGLIMNHGQFFGLITIHEHNFEAI